MAKAPAEIRSLARVHTVAAINTLVGIMNQPEATPAARVMAANSILDRGWGKPTQVLSDEAGGPVQLMVAWQKAPQTIDATPETVVTKPAES